MENTFGFTLAALAIFSFFSLTAQPERKRRVLFVLTSHDKLGTTGKKTGFWIEEFATPYYYFIDRNIEVVVATPNGGQAPIDPKSNEPDFQTESTKRFFKDAASQKVLAQTKKLSQVDEKDFDAIFYPGGHGPMWDLANDKSSIDLIKSFYGGNKPIAFVCHGPAALVSVKDDNGKYVIAGKKVTGFSNTEEEAVQLTKVVPFSLEDKLKERGASYEKGQDWSTFIVEDGLLLTGQNPQSSHLVAEHLLKMIEQ